MRCGKIFSTGAVSIHAPHTRPPLISSTTAGSSSVLVSPNAFSSFSATFRSILRMIFPLRVFGRPLTNWILSGFAMRLIR